MESAVHAFTNAIIYVIIAYRIVILTIQEPTIVKI